VVLPLRGLLLHIHHLRQAEHRLHAEPDSRQENGLHLHQLRHHGPLRGDQSGSNFVHHIPVLAGGVSTKQSGITWQC